MINDGIANASPGINLMELDFNTGAAGEVRNLWNGTGGLVRLHQTELTATGSGRTTDPSP